MIKYPYVCIYKYTCIIFSVLPCVSAQCSQTPWTLARWAPLSMGFLREKYWSGLLFPPPGDLPDPGTEPVSPASPALAEIFFTTSTTGIPSVLRGPLFTYIIFLAMLHSLQISAPPLRIEPRPWQWKHGILTIKPRGTPERVFKP